MKGLKKLRRVTWLESLSKRGMSPDGYNVEVQNVEEGTEVEVVYYGDQPSWGGNMWLDYYNIESSSGSGNIEFVEELPEIYEDTGKIQHRARYRLKKGAILLKEQHSFSELGFQTSYRAFVCSVEESEIKRSINVVNVEKHRQAVQYGDLDFLAADYAERMFKEKYSCISLKRNRSMCDAIKSALKGDINEALLIRDIMSSGEKFAPSVRLLAKSSNAIKTTFVNKAKDLYETQFKAVIKGIENVRKSVN